MSIYTDQEPAGFYPKAEDGGVDYFDWCASFLTAPPKEGYVSSASSTCSSTPPSERSTPNASPYSTPEQYPPPSPSDAPMAQYYYEQHQEEPSSRLVGFVPQHVFQTINIVQQYQKHNHSQVLSHSQGGFNVTQARPHHQLAHNKMDALHNSKEVLLIDHSKEVQKRKALVMDVTPIGSGVPEFTFSPSDPNAEEVRITLRPSLQLPQSFYRNCYEMLRMKVPGGGSDGYRVYVHQKLGYSGNAKRFKQGPDAGERAFVLEGEILNQNMEPIIQCQACEEYFRDASRRILLIKNNVPIRITDKRDG